MKYKDYVFQAKRCRQAPQLLMVFLLFMLTGPALWAQAPDLSGCPVFSDTFLECSKGINPNTPNGSWNEADPDGTFESVAGGSRKVTVDLNCVAIEPGCGTAADLELSLAQSYSEDVTGCSKTIVNEWLVRDLCGNVSTDRIVVRHEFENPSSFDNISLPIPPADQTLQCREDVSSPGALTAEEDCIGDITVVGMDTDDGGSGCVGNPLIITRTWTFEDGCGNEASVSQTITVEDDTKPIFPKPSDMTLTTSAGADCPDPASISLTVDQANPIASGNAAFNFTVHGVNIAGPTVYSDNCSSGSSLGLYVWNIIEDFDGPATACERKIRVIYRVYDACGNFQQRQQTFTIVDDTAPVAPAAPADLDLQCLADITKAGELTATDACTGPITATGMDTDNGGSGCLGDPLVITRTWTFGDGCGNSSSVSQTIKVEDDTPPVVNCPSNINESTDPDECTWASQASDLTATFSDNCGIGSVEWKVTFPGPGGNMITGMGDASGTVFPVGTSTVMYRLTDLCGNETPCTSTVTIADNEPPAIVCPATQAVVLDGNCEALLPDYTGLAMVNDNCGVASVMQSPVPGTTVGATGTEAIVLTVTDSSANSASCTFTLEKLDQTPPTLVCLTNTIFLDPFGEYTLMDTDVLDFNASFDNCSAITVTGISPDFFTCDDLDQTFTVLVEAEDASGNSATCNAAITVDQGTALLPPWEQTTLGTGTGDAIYQPCDNDGEFTLTSNTRLFPMNTDNYQYVYQQLCGDITITAKITQFAPNGWQGLYIRNVGGNNAAGLAFRVQGNTTTMPSTLGQAHLRQMDGGALELSQFSTVAQPYWLRITSTPLWYGGRLVQLYASPNGTNWTLAQSRIVSGLNNCVDVGLILQSQDFNTTVEAKFAYVSATGTAPMLLQGPNSPTVQQQPSVRTAELFPNPASSQVTVVFSQGLEMDTPYILRNQLGQVVRQGFFKAGDSTVELDVADLASGWYVVQPSNGTPPLRFVKQ